MRNRMMALLLALFGVLLGAQVHVTLGWSVPLPTTLPATATRHR